MSEYTEEQAKKIAGYVELYSQVQEAISTYQMAKQISLSFPVTPETTHLYQNAVSSAKECLRKSLGIYLKEVPSEVRDKIKFGKPMADLEKILSATD